MSPEDRAKYGPKAEAWVVHEDRTVCRYEFGPKEGITNRDILYRTVNYSNPESVIAVLTVKPTAALLGILWGEK